MFMYSYQKNLNSYKLFWALPSLLFENVASTVIIFHFVSTFWKLRFTTQKDDWDDEQLKDST